MRQLERLVFLSTIDRLWIEHLTAMDEMRQGIGLQAYGQQDPLIAYKTEGYRMFQALLGNLRHDIAHQIYHVEFVRPAPPAPMEEAVAEPRATTAGDQRQAARPPRRPAGRQGRPQRPLPLRQRQEVQELPRPRGRRRGLAGRGVTAKSAQSGTEHAEQGRERRFQRRDAEGRERAEDERDWTKR